MKISSSGNSCAIVGLPVLFLNFYGFIVNAFGDGPGTFLNQNFLPSGYTLIKKADININVVETTIFHTFFIGGRFAKAMFIAKPGYTNNSVSADAPDLPAPDISASGFGDGFMGVPAFSMNAYLRVWFSGSYDNTKPLNLGTNRTAFEFGFSSAIPLSMNIKRDTWLEVYPSVRFYSTNTNPIRITQAGISHRVPFCLLENHLSHNFTTNLWAGINPRCKYGGAMELDDVKQDYYVNVLVGSVSVGYQAFPFLSFSSNYGGILAGDNEAKSNMFRLSAVFTYVNTRKLKAQVKPEVVAPVVLPAVVVSDNNGLPVGEDKCPTEFGTIKYRGSPIPDRDVDGINNEEDQCPENAGLGSNKGCPEMTFYYKRADANLSSADKANLDKLVEWMNRSPGLNMSIEGHTSTLGANAYNQRLSEKRAQNTYEYLVSKGIDPARLKAVGFGEQFPVGDNATENGRSKSRRVVMRIAQW
nr:OmpA family protein [Flavihumibacter fluvii]